MHRLTPKRAFLFAAGLAALPAAARAQWPIVATVAISQSFAPRLEAGMPGPLPLFPATHWWNVDVSSAPVDGGSAGFLDYIDAEGIRPLHPDFGGTLADGVSIYGFPYIIVGANQAKKTVEFVEPSESDGVDHSTETSFPFYPIPDEAIGQPHWIEGGAPGNVDLTGDEDRHVLMLDRDQRRLYELYNVYYDGSTWHGYAGAVFDLTSNARRPDGWTSADAAGLAILPGLVRYDEAYGNEEIHHAFRLTVRHTRGYVYPASHKAGLQDPPALPMGARLRLKPGVQVASPDPGVQRIVRALKTYGVIVADNGTDMYVSGTWDERWDNGILNPALGQLTADDFEVLELGWKPPVASALAVDARPGGASNQNGVLEPGESAIVEPSWENPEGAAAALSGAASALAGPSGATYMIQDAAATYGSPAAGAPVTCYEAAANCYRMAVSNPAVRPALHWDAAVTETVNLTAAKTWTLHVGGSFADVATSNGFYSAIENLFHNGVTAGCGGSSYCPSAAATRAQMAVFLLKAKFGRAYRPPAASGKFADVPPGSFAADWIEDLAASGITAGCGGPNFCPNAPVTRAQMAVFLLKAKHGGEYSPPAAAGVFADVLPSNPFAPWIERLAAEGVTAGCGAGNYCPGSANTRGEMAVFLTRTFGLRLYGP
jgi:hypothetical protein